MLSPGTSGNSSASATAAVAGSCGGTARTFHRWGDEALQRLEQRRGINRFRHVTVHARFQTLLPFLDRGVGRHGNDRKARESRVRPDFPGRLVSIHFRHLNVHQHHVKIRRHRLLQHLADRLQAVVSHLNRCAHALQQLHGDLLVDLVVFGQKNPHAPQPVRMAVDRRSQCRSVLPGSSEKGDQSIDQHRRRYRLQQEPVHLHALGFFAHLLAPKGGDQHDGRVRLQLRISL